MEQREEKVRAVSRREDSVCGKRYAVTRYFSGGKKLGEIVAEVAARRAARETEPPRE